MIRRWAARLNARRNLRGWDDARVQRRLGAHASIVLPSPPDVFPAYMMIGFATASSFVRVLLLTMTSIGSTLQTTRMFGRNDGSACAELEIGSWLPEGWRMSSSPLASWFAMPCASSSGRRGASKYPEWASQRILVGWRTPDGSAVGCVIRGNAHGLLVVSRILRDEFRLVDRLAEQRVAEPDVDPLSGALPPSTADSVKTRQSL